MAQRRRLPLDLTDQDLMDLLRSKLSSPQGFSPLTTCDLYSAHPREIHAMLKVEEAPAAAATAQAIDLHLDPNLLKVVTEEHALFFTTWTAKGKRTERKAGDGWWRINDRVNVNDTTGNLQGSAALLKYHTYDKEAAPAEGGGPGSRKRAHAGNATPFNLYEYTAKNVEPELALCVMKISQRKKRSKTRKTTSTKTAAPQHPLVVLLEAINARAAMENLEGGGNLVDGGGMADGPSPQRRFEDGLPQKNHLEDHAGGMVDGPRCSPHGVLQDTLLLDQGHTNTTTATAPVSPNASPATATNRTAPVSPNASPQTTPELVEVEYPSEVDYYEGPLYDNEDAQFLTVDHAEMPPPPATTSGTHGSMPANRTTAPAQSSSHTPANSTASAQISPTADRTAPAQISATANWTATSQIRPTAYRTVPEKTGLASFPASIPNGVAGFSTDDHTTKKSAKISAGIAKDLHTAAELLQDADLDDGILRSVRVIIKACRISLESLLLSQRTDA